jgi:hypothetical protein
LVEVERGSDPAECKTVGLGDTVNVIRCDHGAGTGHILHNEVGIAGHIFAHVAGDESGPEVVDIAGGVAGDDADRLALKIRRLSLHRRDGEKDNDS